MEQLYHNPIICQKCGKDTGYYREQFTFCVILQDIHCPYCNTVIVVANSPRWTEEQKKHWSDEPRWYKAGQA